ncbi:hypothetical protein EVAR_71619_1 [Eumeta japonica]|uniref:Uncharacterized protein n=1 Tax=Eumeta variegata TaxID=151549 RepID=A0A4C1SV64_EUMVA|nr:hypothetical protein EVAR_71619_1 [Eumeta japonica]
MDKNMESLLTKLDEKLTKQVETITQSVTKNVMEALDKKLSSIIEENNNLKIRVSELEQKLIAADRNKRMSNLVFFGADKEKKSEAELVDHIKDIIMEMGVLMDSQEISKIYRIGNKLKTKTDQS